ncbi:hypothetical protein GCM10020360_00440 [Nonlabens tegetincola]
MLVRFAIGLGATAALLATAAVGPAVAAEPGPVPDSGPEAGGTSVTLPGLPEEAYVSISAGRDHSLALGTSGTVYAWGANGNGQLGNGTKVDAAAPVPVVMPEGVKFTEVSGGGRFSLALAEDGSAYAWGAGFNGQLGLDSRDDALVPTRVHMPAGVTFAALSAGQLHSLAITPDGTGYSWGTNAGGRLGIGDANENVFNSFVPIKMLMPAGVTFAEIHGSFVHSAALGTNGIVYTWGESTTGQLGSGETPLLSAPTAVTLPGGALAQHVAVGQVHTLALGEDGTTYSWGQNLDKQLGVNLEPLNSLVPVEADGVAGRSATQLRGGGTFSFAFAPGGELTAWGTNPAGLTGEPGVTTSVQEAPVALPSGVTPVDVRTGYGFTLVLGSDEELYAWGDNPSGQLGNGSTTASDALAQVPRPEVNLAGVSFGGVAAAEFEELAVGAVRAVTPPHAPGPVDVVVNWEIAGVPQPPITYSQSFTYTGAPAVTDPKPQVVNDGATARFEVAASGSPAPTVAWEVSRDGGKTWEPVASDPAATVSTDGLSLQVAADLAHSGFQYRAIATSAGGEAVSAGALLTVQQATVVDPGGPGGQKPTGPQGPNLATSGSIAPLAGAALAALLLAAGAVLAASTLARRR